MMANRDQRVDSAGRAVVTGVHRKQVIKDLESLAPRPSLPTEAELRTDPLKLYKFQLELFDGQRNDQAYTHARFVEFSDRIEAEIEELKLNELASQQWRDKIDSRLDRLENNDKSQGQCLLDILGRLDKADTKIETLQTTWEDAYSNFDKRLVALEQRRVPRSEKRQDDLETRQQQQYSELLQRLDRLEAGITELRSHNGGPPPTPRAPTDYPRDPTGSEGK